jgi:glutamyl-tRNA synthetase
MKAETVYELVSEWAQKYDEDFYKVFTKDKAFSTEMVNIDRESPKPRKDIAKWEEVKEYFSYMFNEYYVSNFELPENIKMEDAKAILTEYIKVYDTNDDKDIWFNKIKELCEPLGFTPNVKEYKQNPESFKGHVGDVSTVIRLAVTGRKNTPDLYSIMKLLGKDEVVKRLSSI